MKLINRQYLATPLNGTRKIAAWLKSHGQWVVRKRVRRLMRMIDLKAVYHLPRLSEPVPGRRIYPCLLGDVKITRPNQVLGYRTLADLFTSTLVEAPSGCVVEFLIRPLEI
ncbi:MAG: IS3 family transposase [Dehalococcoidia bacterium]|nr:IS3 family transposase [Dehalococcoidia bacterium]